MTQTTDVALLPEFVRFLETGEVAPGAFAADVFFDMNVPSWRYQIQGHEAAASLFHSEEPARVRVGTCHPDRQPDSSRSPTTTRSRAAPHLLPLGQPRHRPRWTN